MIDFLARQASAGRLMLCHCYFLSSSFFFFFFFFDDRLEQKGLGNYKTSLHQIFTDGRHVVGCRCSVWYGFRDRSRDVAMATNFRREIGLAFHSGWQNGKAYRIKVW